MTKKSPILAVNEPVKKTTRKRPATRKATGSKKTASGRTSGRTSKGRRPSVGGRCLRGVITCCSVSLEPVLSSVFIISLFVRTPTAGNPAMA